MKQVNISYQINDRYKIEYKWSIYTPKKLIDDTANFVDKDTIFELIAFVTDRDARCVDGKKDFMEDVRAVELDDLGVVEILDLDKNSDGEVSS